MVTGHLRRVHGSTNETTDTSRNEVIQQLPLRGLFAEIKLSINRKDLATETHTSALGNIIRTW